MIRYIKTLGLALVAIFAMSAMAASAASAQGMITSDGPVTLDANELATGNALTAPNLGAETVCPGSSYVGHKIKSTPHEFIPSGASEVTLTPKYNQPACVSKSGGSEFSSTVQMTSCDYELKVLGTTGTQTEPTYGTDIDIVCDQPGDAIHVTQFSGESHGFRVCSITVTAQNDLISDVHVTDETNGKLLVQGTVTEIDLKRSGLCGSATDTEGEFHINATVEGTNSLGETTPISLSHTA